MRVLASIAITVFSLSVTLLAVEVLFRLVPNKKDSWSDRPRYYYQHALSPTLQDYPYSPQKGSGIFRIAVVGDSFSFAPYMQFDDAFPKKLERMLNLGALEKKAEVINYAVPAYSTVHEVPKVKQALSEEADLVLLQITLNDPEIKGETPIGISVHNRFGPPEYGRVMKWLVTHSRLVAFVSQRLHNSKTERAYRDYFLDLYDNPRSWNMFKKAVGEIVAVCKERNKPLAAVVFPLFGLPLDDRYPFYSIHDRVNALLTELQVPHTDISSIYNGIPLERLQVIPGVDRHPNEIGHRMAAERVYDWLADEQLIPKELLIQRRFRGRTKIIKEQPFIDPQKAVDN